LTESEQQERRVAWDFRIPLVTNIYMMADCTKVMAITWVVCSALVLLIGLIVDPGDVKDLLPVVPMFGIVAAAIWVVMVLVMLVFYGNRFYARFEVTSKGAHYGVSTTQRKLNKVIVVLGILAGKPGVAGSGMLAQSQEEQFFAWSDVFRVDLDPRRRVVILRNTWRTLIRLYCTPENYEEVAAIAREGVDAAIYSRERKVKRAGETRRSVVQHIFNRWSALAVLSCFLATATPLLDLDDYGRAILLAGGLALLAAFLGGSARKLFGFLCLGITGWLVYSVFAEGAKVGLDMGFQRLTNYQLINDTDEIARLWMSIAGLLGLTVCGVRGLFARERCKAEEDA